MPAEAVDHPRKIVRALVVAKIKGASPDYATAAGRDIYDSRDIPLDDAQMPVVLIYTERERIVEDQRHVGGIRRRIMDLAVEAYDTSHLAAETVDRIAWQVEELLRADPLLGGHVESTELAETRMHFIERGELGLACAALRFAVTYCTHFADAPDDPRFPPREVLLGFDPDIGPPHADDYVTVSRVDVEP